MNIRAPAKLILSGEHAVVHGAPALAMAVDYYAAVKVAPLPYPLFTLELPAFNDKDSLDAYALKELRENIEERYKLFQQNKCDINEVLQQPVELIKYALSIIVPLYRIQQGMNLQLTSDIPMGCGMGSSAAAIVSVMYAITACAGFNLPLHELYPLALTAENMQHGHSSGMDVQIALHGGCYYRHGETMSKRQIAHLPLYLVNTGVPSVTTGQCVAAVRLYFNGEKDNLTQTFSDVTNEMDKAWQVQSIIKVVETIRANHRLLTYIGVVPQKVQCFIDELEQNGLAAKICGAGAISGEQGGVVLVLGQDEKALAAACQQYGYHYTPVVGAARGVHEF